MSQWTDHPVTFEINTRVRLAELSEELGRPATLADVPEPALDLLEGSGFDYVWLMGVWRCGPRARELAVAARELHGAYAAALPGWRDEDVAASPYAVAEYVVADELGGDAALAALRDRLARRGVGLILDFIPNHLGLDHPWVAGRPDYFVRDAAGTVLHGRDPNFPPWRDTAQLDYRSPATRSAMVQELRRIAERCDGVRCDMAMLVLEEVFERTWGAFPEPEPTAEGEFWADAIGALRRDRPETLFLAEAYWDLEYRLQQLGFDYTYDKRLYDRLVDGDAAAVRGHLRAEARFQRRCLRFVENHDEPRAAALWPLERHRAAATVALTIPGMRLFHMGQLEGLRRRLPLQLRRRLEEPTDPALAAFYERLLWALRQLAVRRGAWSLLETVPPVIAWTWDAGRLGRWLVVVNHGPEPTSAVVDTRLLGLSGRPVELRDLLSDGRMVVEGNELSRLRLELAGWDARILDLH